MHFTNFNGISSTYKVSKTIREFFINRSWRLYGPCTPRYHLLLFGPKTGVPHCKSRPPFLLSLLVYSIIFWRYDCTRSFLSRTGPSQSSPPDESGPSGLLRKHSFNVNSTPVLRLIPDWSVSPSLSWHRLSSITSIFNPPRVHSTPPFSQTSPSYGSDPVQTSDSFPFPEQKIRFSSPSVTSTGNLFKLDTTLLSTPSSPTVSSFNVFS